MPDYGLVGSTASAAQPPQPTIIGGLDMMRTSIGELCARINRCADALAGSTPTPVATNEKTPHTVIGKGEDILNVLRECHDQVGRIERTIG